MWHTVTPPLKNPGYAPAHQYSVGNEIELDFREGKYLPASGLLSALQVLPPVSNAACFTRKFFFSIMHVNRTI